MEQTLSDFYVADEVRAAWRGVQILLVAAAKARRVPRTSTEVAEILLRIAKAFSFRGFTKAKRAPKKPKIPRTALKANIHVATQRIIDSKKAHKR